jgi:hypothetical protein
MHTKFRPVWKTTSERPREKQMKWRQTVRDFRFPPLCLRSLLFWDVTQSSTKYKPTPRDVPEERMRHGKLLTCILGTGV